jgi:hypothetical protein
MIARLAGVAVDARVMTRSPEPRERAEAARWIAANMLAACGVRSRVRGALPREACVFGVRAPSLLATLAAIAAVPALFDASTLPVRWRLAFGAFGVPVTDRPVEEVLASGASVAAYEATGVDCTVTVGADFGVDVSRRMLVA